MVEISNYIGKKIAILGFGQEGQAVARYLVKRGLKPKIIDQKPLKEWDDFAKNQLKTLNIPSETGKLAFKKISKFDLVFRSPGIKISDLPKGNYMLTSQTKFFFENSPARIIGVTGTKGKGTTSSLIYEMLKESQVFLTGNIGKTQPLDFLDKLTKDYWVIYELSSFQLQDLKQSPHIAVVLMVTSEHLNYHKNKTEYSEAKSSITRFQTRADFTIINSDYETSVNIGRQGQAKKLFFSRKNSSESDCFIKNKKICIKGTNFNLSIQDLKLRGEHNLENICAAALASYCAGADLKSIEAAARHFKGLEHRLELVGSKRGVSFYNDSFSTVPETAIAAIKSFTEPLILILGGSSKKSNFSELGELINKSNNIKAVILVGEEAASINNEIHNLKIKKFDNAKNMKEIFNQILTVAKTGDVVLLSPACASFGMFKNYKDRGEQFKHFVKKLQ